MLYFSHDIFISRQTIRGISQKPLTIFPPSLAEIAEHPIGRPRVGTLSQTKPAAAGTRDRDLRVHCSVSPTPARAFAPRAADSVFSFTVHDQKEPRVDSRPAEDLV